MSVFGYQSDRNEIDNSVSGGNQDDVELEIGLNDIDPILEFNPGRNKYVITKQNLIICRDVAIKSKNGIGQISNGLIRFPVPKFRSGFHLGTLHTQTGDFFYYRMNRDGHVIINGRITGNSSEIYFNMNPYVAETPIRYAPVNFNTDGGVFS